MSLKEALKCVKSLQSWFNVYGFIHKTKNWLANTEKMFYTGCKKGAKLGFGLFSVKIVFFFVFVFLKNLCLLYILPG